MDNTSMAKQLFSPVRALFVPVSSGKVAIDGAGVTNWLSFTSLTDKPDYTKGNFGGEFWDIDELLWERSPLSQVDKIKTPVLILHGAEDARVPLVILSVNVHDLNYLILRSSSIYQA